MLLYPSVHPARRQSQIENHEDINVSSIKANLQSGDVLYVPPFWFHTVKSNSQHSVSLSTVSASQVEYFWSRIIYQQIPFYRLKVGIERVLGVRIFIEALLHELHVESKELMRDMFNARYLKIFKTIDDSVPTKWFDVKQTVDKNKKIRFKRFNCNNFPRLKKVAVVLSEKDDMISYNNLGSAVDKVVFMIANFKDQYPLSDGILEILLYDYIEELLLYAVGNEQAFDIAVVLKQCFLL